MGASPSTVVVTDASVLVNFLRIDRMDLIAGHSHAFIVTDHVADEVSAPIDAQIAPQGAVCEVGFSVVCATCT